MAAATQLQLHTLSQDEIENLVFIDSLCKLPNRRFLEQCIPELLSSLEGAALFCFIDIDHFKQANQTGHAFGDALLAAFSQRLLSVLRADDVIARFGGDEFVLIVRGLHPESLSSQGTVICERLLEQMRKPFQIQQTQYQVTMSIGCCPIYLPSTQNLDGWITKADLALREAKLQGGNRLVMQAAQSVMSHPSHSIASSAQAALQKDAQGSALGAEIMLPHDLSHLDHWFTYLEVLRKRFQTNLEDQQNNFWLSIDLPLSLSLNHPRFSQALLQGLHQFTSMQRLDPKVICLEIDEHWLLQSTALVGDLLTQIRAANYVLCLDHYGRAQSRLHSQSQYAFDRVKIAASLCEQLTHQPNAYQSQASTQIRAILAVAQALGQTPIALLPAMQRPSLELLQALPCPYHQESFTEG
jgi:diguanylate cyclase (GGDEF)-like protein